MEKQRWGESDKKKREKKEDAGARKGRKVAIHCVFPMVCGSGGSNSRLTKAAGAEPAGQMRDEKLYAVVVRSTLGSKTTKNTSRSVHFWQLTSRKSARRCGAKHISKSKSTKHTILGPVLEGEMSKKSKPLRREARSPVKMYKAHQRRTTFGSWDVEKVHAVVPRKAHLQGKMLKTPHVWTTFGRSDVEKVHAVVARSTFGSQKCQKLQVSNLFWRSDVEKEHTN